MRRRSLTRRCGERVRIDMLGRGHQHAHDTGVSVRYGLNVQPKVDGHKVGSRALDVKALPFPAAAAGRRFVEDDAYPWLAGERVGEVSDLPSKSRIRNPLPPEPFCPRYAGAGAASIGSGVTSAKDHGALSPHTAASICGLLAASWRRAFLRR